MRNYLKNLIVPYKHIKREPYQFSVWLIGIILFGLAGLWFQMISECFGNENFFLTFKNFLRVGSMSTFCIAILADGLATALVAVGAGVSVTSAGIRGVYTIIAIGLVMLNAIILNYVSRLDSISFNFITVQTVITVITIMLASGLYNLRTSDWEKSVEDVTRKQDKQISELQRDAERRIRDDEGVIL